jgi:riboflavin kinase/FMN adenylyltransferase
VEGFTPHKALITDSEKEKLLGEMGVEAVKIDFLKIKDYEPVRFFEDIIIKELNAGAVSCGFNYRFGKGGEGDVKRLIELCSKYGIDVEAREPVTVDGEQVSSSRIRELIASGDIKRANKMLGYRYAISGDIAGGNHLGTGMGFPTVNIPIGGELIVPRYGVYASKVTVGGREYIGATNIGVHPTVGENDKPLCESFLLDCGGGDLYGRYAVCELCDFVRDETVFGSFDELKAQIDADCERIKGIMTE